MIYAELAGGLGNQMFIYAFARALGLTQTAAKQRLFRGRKTLRDTLTKGGVEA